MPQEQSFWDFACTVYDKEALQRLLLTLQEDLHLDVNCLLFCLWITSAGRGVEDEAFWNKLVQQSTAWQADVIAPIRSARNSLKHNQYFEGDSGYGEYRKGLLKQELEAEKIQIDWMERTHSSATDYVTLSAEDSLLLYLNALPFELTDEAREKVLTLRSFVL